ncbi:MAG: alanine--tRNA ligase [Actinomycetota bacterium]|nr:alanine--tRNA ligase [Actinomycetota bacterium]
MDSRTIRDKFLTFFGERDHTLVPSSSLVPNDPNLLVTNAGMNQFKPYFLGEQTPPFARAMSVQKCFRTPDIEEVGKDARHLTFFEMLGNFSFGDYYKEKACPWAWELVTERWGIDPDSLWISIFETDDEAHDIWVDAVGVRPERVVRRGAVENFWSMGVAGPCGPDSEIFVDRGDAVGPPSPRGPIDDEERYLEIWNLVFMQNECNAAIEPVADLPRKNIDTGSGLERVALVLQKAASVFETDILGGMIRRAEELTKSTYGRDDRTDKALRILADHGRGLTLLVADGVLPSNEERGYVVRRIMRRAVRHARLLGHEGEVLPPLIDATIELMGNAYPEIRERRNFIVDVASREEDRFSSTLRQGLSLLEGEIQSALDRGAKTLPGTVAFRLHDTFGFPIDLTNDVASDAGLDVDAGEFEKLMGEQRQRARAARRAEQLEPSADALGSLLEEHGATEFIGYEHLSTPARVIGIADGTSGRPVATEGAEVDIVLDRTAFYPEGGGQVGDRGLIVGPSGRAEVRDTRRIVPGLVGHRVLVVAGDLSIGDEVRAEVDSGWRVGAQRAHTAPHMLHWILRDRLGEHASQAGSLVEPGRLRFDFNHFEPLGPGRVNEFSDELQSRVLYDDAVRAYETSYDFARSIGAMAIFGEKYGDFVRVVEVGDYSKELCGGTHVPHTSQIGVAVITSEGSVGANLRRVEALVGSEGLEYLRRRVAVLQRAADTLKTNPEDVADRVERLLQTQRDMERRLAQIERRSAETDADALAGSATDVDGTRLVVARRDIGVDGLRALAQTLKGRLGSAVIVLGTGGEGRANLVGAVTKDLVERGISARDILAPGAGLLGGGAGGKPDLAISGGPSAERLEEAITAVAQAARDALAR